MTESREESAFLLCRSLATVFAAGSGRIYIHIIWYNKFILQGHDRKTFNRDGRSYLCYEGIMGKIPLNRNYSTIVANGCKSCGAIYDIRMENPEKVK